MTARMDQLKDLKKEISRAGYYPALVTDVLEIALAGEPVRAFLVHPETMFDRAEVRRHITALVLTPTRLVIAHVDDVPGEGLDDPVNAAATTEAIGLKEIRGVGFTHGVANPETYTQGSGGTELTIAINWGSVSRIDFEPATCPDPACEADHGYTGTAMPDDLVVRISAHAEGPHAMNAAIHFASEISAATTGAVVQ